MFDKYLNDAVGLYLSEQKPWVKLNDIQLIETLVINAHNDGRLTDREYRVLYSLVSFLHVRIRMTCDNGGK